MQNKKTIHHSAHGATHAALCAVSAICAWLKRSFSAFA